MLDEKQSTGRFSTPEQIGALTLFLCSDAAINITGTTTPSMAAGPRNNGEEAHFKKASAQKPQKLKLNLALQGGGGAFTWGVLDRLLEEGISKSAALAVAALVR